MSKPNYEKISKELIREFINIFEHYTTAKVLLKMGCSYNDLIALGIDKDEAHYAMLDEVVPKNPTPSLDLEIVDDNEEKD
jgi:hypothetical protein